MEEFKLYDSTRKDKKYMVLVNGKIIHFGQAGSSDFTIHKDVERRNRYRARHAADNIQDPFSPGFWSWWALWGESSDLSTAFKQAVNRAKRLINTGS